MSAVSPAGKLRVGTRASRLALTQTQLVADTLAAAHPGLSCELVRVTTTGDRRRDRPLPAIGGKGLFTKELEEALLRGEVDLAVHSLKDLPTELPEGLGIGAIPERAPANDALITADGRPFGELPEGARIGTSSPRRAAQLLAARPDLRPEPIRGNVDTRLRKLRDGQFHAIVLALAGLTRLSLTDQVTQVLPFDLMLPAPGQGALACETRAGDEAVARILAAIHDPPTAAAVSAERALLQALGGGCSLPLGTAAEHTGNNALRLRAALLSPDGRTACRAERTGMDPATLAQAVADDLRAAGADQVLRALQP